MNNTEEFKNTYDIKSAEDAIHFTAEASKQAKKGEIACILFDNLGNNERKSITHPRKDGETNLLCFPKITEEKLDYDKLQFKFSNNQSKYKTDLIQFYKDGILIKVPSVKNPDYLEVNLLSGLYEYDSNTSPAPSPLKAAFFHTLFRCWTSRGRDLKTGPQSFFGESFFTDWRSDNFKDNLYVLVDGYSSTTLLKFSLNIFKEYQSIKNKIISTKTPLTNNGKLICGMDRGFYLKKLHKMSFIIRGSTLENHALNHAERTIRIGCVGEFFRIYSKLCRFEENYDEMEEVKPGFKNEIKEWKKDRGKSSIKLLRHFYEVTKERLDKDDEEKYNEAIKAGKTALSIGGKKQTRLFFRAVDFFLMEENSESKEETLFKLMKDFSDLSINELDVMFWPFFKFNCYNNEPETINGFSSFFYFFTFFGRAVFLGFKVNDGDQLPCGKPIITENMTETDAFIYWEHFPNVLLLNSEYLEGHQCPLVFEDDRVLNTLNPDARFDSSIIERGGFIASPPMAKEVTANVQEMLSEALDNSRYNIPYGGFYEMKDEQSDIIKGARLFETENLIYIFLYDENERFLFEILQKPTKHFIGYLFREDIFHIKKFSAEDLDSHFQRLTEEIHSFISHTIRDMKVCINRDIVCGPVQHRVPTGIKTNRKRIIYLPRIKYNRIGNRQPLDNEIKIIRKNSGGFRSHHVRKLPKEAKASPLQIVLAQRQNIYVPPDHTYVRSHTFGEKSMTQDEVTYRSRSITGMVYFSEKVIPKAEEIVRMSPAGFEEHCKKIISQMGWIVTRDRVSDEGIDIEAYKSSLHKDEEKITRLFVQCKHQKKNVGPEVIRELLGAEELQDRKYKTELMIITSGKFSSGAVVKAKEKGIKLIDGNDLLKQK